MLDSSQRELKITENSKPLNTPDALYSCSPFKETVVFISAIKGNIQLQ